MTLLAKARAQIQQKVNPPSATPPAVPAQAPKSATPSRRPVKAVLSDNKVDVVFQFNPETIKIGHQPDTKPMNRTMGAKERKPDTVVGGNPNEVIMSAGEAVGGAGTTGTPGGAWELRFPRCAFPSAVSPRRRQQVMRRRRYAG